LLFLPSKKRTGYNLVLDLYRASWIITRSKQIATQAGVIPPAASVNRPHLTLAYGVRKFDAQGAARQVPFPVRQLAFAGEYATPYQEDWTATI
jgi:hypothetical protein